MYRQVNKASHSHRWFIDANTGDYMCFCGVQKGKDEKRVKFHNKTSVYNGHWYQSQFESQYAAELDWRVKCKDIVKWERQVKLDLRVDGMHITNYYIDFIVHYPDGSREYVETKGYETETWKMKWRLLEATFESFKQNPDDRLLIVKEKSTNFRRKG